MVETGIKLNHTTKAELKSYEEKNYNPKFVVDEQLQMWLEAQESTPDSETIHKKRVEFEEQERKGVLRVFK